jgi:hypothetical protein
LLLLRVLNVRLLCYVIGRWRSVFRGPIRDVVVSHPSLSRTSLAKSTLFASLGVLLAPTCQLFQPPNVVR